MYIYKVGGGTQVSGLSTCNAAAALVWEATEHQATTPHIDFADNTRVGDKSGNYMGAA